MPLHIAGHFAKGENDGKKQVFTDEMRKQLQKLADMANQCSDEVWDDEEPDGTGGILILCDQIATKVEKYLENTEK